MARRYGRRNRLSLRYTVMAWHNIGVGHENMEAMSRRHGKRRHGGRVAGYHTRLRYWLMLAGYVQLTSRLVCQRYAMTSWRFYCQ